MRISDWSSDVCSSDLPQAGAALARRARKGLEDVALGLLGHAGAVVFDVDHQEVAHRARRQVQLPGAGIERIVVEVDEHAIELLAVSFDAIAAIHLVHQADASAAELRTVLAHPAEEIDEVAMRKQPSAANEVY